MNRVDGQLELENELEGSKAPPGGVMLFLFLSLFLLVLAFFIVMVAISNLEKSKAARVIRNLNSTFSTPVTIGIRPQNVVSKSGPIVAAEKHQEEIRTLFNTGVKVAKVEIIRPGRSMLIRLPKGSLFLPDKETIRESRKPLLRNIAVSLGRAPEGTRFDMEMVIGSDYVGELSLPVTQTLTMRRLGAFARELTDLGAPSDSIAIGTQHASPDEVKIWFFIRQRGESHPRFDAPASAE